MKTAFNTKSEVVTAALTKFPKARKIAVENVSSWYRGTHIDNMNLSADIASYNWNPQTVNAIKFVYRHSKNLS